MFAKKYIISFLMLIVPFTQGMAQLPLNVGHTYLETFQNKCGSLEKSQIWNVVPGNEEYVFFASNYGLGVYDGVRWETNNTEDGLVMRSLYFEPKTNTLYCGSVNQFGKWEQNDHGKFFYTPLWVNKSENLYMEFWRIDSPVNGGNIYVQSHQAILRYNYYSQKTDTIRLSDNLSYMHMVSGDVWVQDKNELYRIEPNNELHKIIDVEDRIIHVSKRESDGAFLVFFEHIGVFVLSNNFSEIRPLNIQTNRILSTAKIFTVSNDKKQLFLIGTTRGGLYIMDESGNIVKNVGENQGLPTSTVLSVGVDNHENVWLGLDAGVATLDAGGKESYFSPKPSIGSPKGIVAIQNNIFIGTNQGLFKLAENGSFYPIEGMAGPVWSMNNVGGELYYSHDLGLFHLKGETPVCIKKGGTTSLVQSLRQPDYFVGGDYYGLSLYKRVNGELQYVSKIKNFAGTARYMNFDKSGYLWIMVPKEGFHQITLSEDMLSVQETRKFAIPIKSNKDYMLMPVIDDHIVFYDGFNAYSFNAQNQEFIEDKSLSELFHLCGNNLVSISQFDNVFWYQTPDDVGYVVRKGNVYEKNSGLFSRIYNRRISPFMAKLDTKTYAIGYQNGIAFTELTPKIDKHLKIRMVEGYGTGSPVYKKLKDSKFELPYNKRIINVYPLNLNPDHIIEYRILETDKKWTREKIDNSLTLTHLDWGTYTLQLRNANDRNSAPSQLVISIARPWFISNWMFLAYAFVLGCIISLIAMFYKRKTEKEKRRIERAKQLEVEKLEKKNMIQSQLILELEKDKLEIEVQEKDKRLAFITMNGVKRNNLMNELKKEIQEAEKTELNKEARQTIKNAIRKIEQELENNDDWEIFEKYFNVVFSGLLENIVVKYPHLTQGDLKLLAYIKLNLNNKEIANLLNISFRSVEMAKYRLRKKLGLEANDNFSAILNENTLTIN